MAISRLMVAGYICWGKVLTIDKANNILAIYKLGKIFVMFVTC